MPQALPFVFAATAVAGIGMQVVGMQKQASASKEMAAQQQEQIRLQQQAEAQRQQMMELDARRKQMEIFRQQQRTRAMAVSTANNQGGLFGSGIQGGLGQIAGQAGTQLTSLGQNLEIGRNIFGINSQISDSRILSSQAQSQYMSGQSISALGGTLISNIGRINSLTGGGMGGGSTQSMASNINPALIGSFF